MKVKLLVEIELDDLPLEERQRHAAEMDCPLSEIPLVSEQPEHVELGIIRRGIEGLLQDHATMDEWLWAGSDTYARITGAEVKIAT